MPASLNTSASKNINKMSISPIFNSSPIGVFPSSNLDTAVSTSANHRQVYILPPPQSFTGYHLTPPPAQYYQPSPASPIYYETKKQKKSHYGGMKRTAEESSASKKPRKHYKRNSDDPVSAAAATLASFAGVTADNHDENLSKQEVQIIEAAKILMDISRCVSVAH